MTEAHIAVRPYNSTVDIQLSGDIDLSNSASVQNDIFASISNDLLAVHLDLSDLTYIDSAGVHLLFELAEKLRLLQMQYTVTAPSGSLTRQIIELAGLGSMVNIYG